MESTFLGRPLKPGKRRLPYLEVAVSCLVGRKKMASGGDVRVESSSSDTGAGSRHRERTEETMDVSNGSSASESLELSLEARPNPKGETEVSHVKMVPPRQSRLALDLLVALNGMRMKGEHCDVVLVSGAHKFTAHKAVLAASSPYFNALFKYEHSALGNACTARFESDRDGASSDSPECGKRTFEMKDVAAGVLEQILNFIYNDTVSLTTENVEDVMIAANMLHLVELKRMCADFLMQHLDTDNCFGLRAFADVYSSTELKREADALISKLFHQVSQTEEFLLQDFDTVCALLERSDLKVKSEEQIFEAFLRWVKHDIPGRVAVSHKLLKVIRIKLLSPDYIRKKMNEEAFLWQDKDLSVNLLSYIAGINAPHGSETVKLNETQEVRALPETIYAVGGRDANRLVCGNE